MAKILGIDLGTTNSCMAVVEKGEARVIENAEGGRTTPSVVAIGKSGERLVGITAKRQAVTNPQQTIYSAKRLIGRRFDDPEVQRDRALLSYEIRQAANGGVEIKFGDQWVTPQEISSMVLAKLKADAEARLGEKITDAVITVPAYFDDSQRRATKEAGEIAGFNVRRIINEPTAAALAYGLEKKKDEKIVVYDFGGGTFDVSVLEISEDTVEVKATGGDTHLGGDDFDQKVIAWIVEEFRHAEGIDLSKDRLALQRIKDAAERAKMELSTLQETEVNLPFITSGPDGPKHLTLRLTRAKLEELVSDFIVRAEEIVKRVVSDAKFSLSDIDEVILVGGQTRMPAIQESVRRLFGKDPHIGINPDEVVAVGAAVQGGILQGEVKDILLLDVTPLTLGIETLGGVMTPLVERNTTIPVSRTEIFSTASDNQTSVEVHVLQGERPMASDNKTLGRFILDGIPPAPRGVPQIEVTFDIDVNGILTVRAKDKATGKEQAIRIEASTGLSKEEVERMRKEAELHAEEDRKRREMADLRNQAETIIWTTEKSLRDLGEKVPEATRRDVEAKLAELKKVKDGNDAAAIRRAIEESARAAQAIGQAVYGGGAQSENSSAPPQDDKDQSGPRGPSEADVES
jgi:molecular chaperone DnaK